jgi:hypothetical protein
LVLAFLPISILLVTIFLITGSINRDYQDQWIWRGPCHQ